MSQTRKNSVNGVRTAKRAKAGMKRMSGRAMRFVKSNPVRIVLGAAALGFVLAKLKNLI